ncbi:hypothetical protein BH23BAC3_BH23BAC3_24200 [soil metagenome]
MKSLFIFITYVLLFCSCASSNQPAQAENNLFIDTSFQHWYATAPGESDYTERGIDLRLELNSAVLISNPLYIIFNERESFPVEVSKLESEDNEEKLLIEARILLDSALFPDQSDHVLLSDRLVYCDEDDNLQYFEINNWKRLPDRYD